MKKELRNILVPVDFNNPSLKAVEYAKNMAVNLDAEIILLHVIQTSGLLADFFSNGDHLVKMTSTAKDMLAEIAQSVNQDGKLKTTSIVERGKAYEHILNTAEGNNVRMIILGENHQGDDANQNLGSTVYHVTQKAQVPVLTLKGNTQKMNSSIVVPLDLTGQMRKQLFSSMVYALNYNAKVHLVSALVGGIKMRDSRIFKKLKQAKDTLVENGVDANTKIFPRSDVPPFRQVIQYAKDINAGMILLMTHKEGYTYDNYIGAFAHHIINKSQVPVLTLTAAAVKDNLTPFIKTFADPAKLLMQ